MFIGYMQIKKRTIYMYIERVSVDFGIWGAVGEVSWNQSPMDIEDNWETRSLSDSEGMSLLS